jgi:glucuronoarabinoxylan endo-1,4-beta-xylanase
MHNCLVHGSVSAYFYWALAWTSESGKGLVRMEFPWDRSRWQTPRGYILPIEYWAFRQFSKFIDAGWKRVSAEVDASTLRISAFINPEGNKLTIVVVNVGTLDEATSFEIQDFDVTNGQVIRTSEFEQGEEIDGNYDGASVIEFPGRSITTLSLSGAVTSVDEAAPSAPFEFSLSQNYPNPFNPTTSIEYSIAQESFVQLKIYDLLGREIKTLVHQKMRAGKHAFRFEANDLASGVYLYQLKAGDFLETKRMILIR